MKSFLEDLLIVIVIFENNPEDTTAFQSLNSIWRETMVLLYDNSPVSHSYVKTKNTIYVHDPSNPGVSKAYNAAAKLASAHNKKWLIMADQDTEFNASFFEKYQHAIDAFPDDKVFVPSLVDHLGLVSPFAFRNGKGKRIGFMKAGPYQLMSFRFANSGMLIMLNLFEAAGGYDERFPLDYSDIAFIDRISKIHPNFILVDSRCRHHFSGSENIQSQILVRRFDSFCRAVVEYKKTSPTNVPLYWVLIPRAIKLSLQQKNPRFLMSAIRVMITESFSFKVRYPVHD